MLNLVLILFLFLFSLVVYAVIIKPYLLCLYYRKQGIPMKFKVGTGERGVNLDNVEKYGDYMYQYKQAANQEIKPIAIGGNIGNMVELLLLDTETIKQFLTYHENYYKPPALFGLITDAIGQGLVFVEGNDWKRHRKIVSIAFNYDLVKEMVPKIAEITREYFKMWRASKKKTVHIMDEFQRITGDIIGRIFFGSRFNEFLIEDKPVTVFLTSLLSRLMTTTLTPGFLLFGKGYIKLGLFESHRKIYEDVEKFRKFSSEFISKRMQELEDLDKANKPYERNMLAIFYEIRKKEKEALSDLEIIDEFTTFFLAGTDTSGHLLTIAAYYSLTIPEYKKILLDEAEKLDLFNPNLSPENLNKQDIMTAFMKECLRVATPAPYVFNRAAIKDHQLGTLHIKKGTTINAAFIGNNFDHRIHNDPDKFDPNRWIDKTSLTYKSIGSNPFAFTPFSLGGRNCIGQHLAMIETKLIFAIFLKEFDFELTDKNFKRVMTLRFLHEFHNPLMIDLKY